MDVNSFLQKELIRRSLNRVNAVEAARWLDEAGILNDSIHRRGKPLRNLLREGKILGSVQEPPRPNGRWFIERVKS
ncbi:hypothetical protein ACOBQJ_12935 [Pelotomaculum propionicicum]|uniref:hypothetical protein n=1 Tax=Pelotomaculum propionicicum TaxID=258475 RepID=UPI003B7CAA8E